MAFVDEFPQYVSAAERKRRASRVIADLERRGVTVKPVSIQGTKLATTFWGKAWCDNLVAYSDYATRLPRGRSYVRNGSVVHLELTRCRIRALVSGSDLYEVTVQVQPLSPERWQRLVAECSGQIHNVVDLLMGRLSPAVMDVLCRKDEGLFPAPDELTLRCTCPDSARLCKHVAAVLYGIGARFDSEPETLFLLRDVDKLDLVEAAGSQVASRGSGMATIPRERVAEVFGVELADDADPIELAGAAKRPRGGVPRRKRRR